jgi:hypothetical protein
MDPIHGSHSWIPFMDPIHGSMNGSHNSNINVQSIIGASKQANEMLKDLDNIDIEIQSC